jgi:hypothetical protein
VFSQNGGKFDSNALWRLIDNHQEPNLIAEAADYNINGLQQHSATRVARRSTLVCIRSIVLDDGHLLIVITEICDKGLDIISVIGSGLVFEDDYGCPAKERPPLRFFTSVFACSVRYEVFNFESSMTPPVHPRAREQ